MEKTQKSGKKTIKVLDMVEKHGKTKGYAFNIMEIYKGMFDASPEAVLIVDKWGKVLDGNKRFYEWLGYRRGEIVGKKFINLPHFKKTSKSVVRKFFSQRNRHKKIMPHEIRLATKNGGTVMGKVIVSPVKDKKDKLLYEIVMISDVTKSKQIEETLKRSEEKYRIVSETAFDGIGISDIDENLIYVNPAFAKIVGYTRKELLGMNLKKISTKDEFKNFKDHTKRRKNGVKEQYETSFVCKNGSIRNILVSASPLRSASGGVKGTIAIITDITERKRNERALRASEEKFRTIFKNVSDEIVYLDKRGKILDINPRSKDVSGYEPKEVIGKNFLELGSFSLKDVPKVKKIFRDCVRGKRPMSRMEFEVKDKKGKRIIVESKINIIKKGGEIDSFVALVRNITEEKEAKDKIKEARDRFRAIFENVNDMIIYLDEGGTIVELNKRVKDIFGFSREEILGKNFAKVGFFEPRELSKIIKFFKDAMSGKRNPSVKQLKAKHKDGSTIFVETSSRMIKTNNKIKGILITVRDVTERQKIDRAKTEFVSFASHELRTPLSTINWYAEMLLSKERGYLTKKQEKYIREIYDGSRKMTELVGDFLNVSRIELGKFMVETKLLNFGKVADDVLKDLALYIERYKLNLTKSYGKNLPKVKADPKLLQIVFHNLIYNAIKYTPPRGKINLSIKKRGSDILITVSDTGYGIPAKDYSKVFTKLFSAQMLQNKNQSGTGLGLYIVKSIIGYSNGKIWFKSTVNKGTTFYVTIPLCGMVKRKGSTMLN
ncbi:MAG: Sensor protein [uncultured bacterium]|nr:MAG: Sensor protein [uncultured bacterium]